MNSPLMLRTQLRTALRHIRKNKAFTLINILGLSLGLCVCLVIYYIVHYELSFDTFHPNGNYIYRITRTKTDQHLTNQDTNTPLILPTTARQSVPGLKAAMGYYPYESHVGNFPSTRTTVFADANYFSVFPYTWLAGDPATALNAANRVVLTETDARKYFGDLPPAQFMGRPLTFNDSLHVYVSGIVKDWSGNSDFNYTAFISLPTIPQSFLNKTVSLDQWDDQPSAPHTFVKLAPGVNPHRVAAQLSALAAGNMHLDPGTTISYSLQPLDAIHFDASIHDGRVKAHLPTLYILMGVAGFILLLAIVNFINLSTAMSLQRAKEIGIRKILGSLRAALIGQFLLETALVTTGAVAIALPMVQPMLSLFHSMLTANLQFHWLTPDLWLFLFGLIVITTLLAGLYPARVISSWIPILCLKGSGSSPAEQKTTLRKGLIIFQFTISLAFIIGTLIVQNQISYMRNQDLGFSTDAVMTIETDVRDQNSLRSVLLAQKISELPGVHKVARQSFDPITSFYVKMPLQYRGKKIIQVDGALQIGDTNFIPLYDIKLLAGTNLSGRDSLKEAVINESMSKAMGFASPADAVGQTIYLGESPIPIKGVVADFHEHSYREAIRPILIGHVSQPENMIAVKLALRGRHPADLKRILAQIENAYKEVYAGQPFPFTYHFLDDAIENMYKKEEQTAFLLRAAVIITVFISCIGLFGLAMYTARQRTKEIGIRKVLGATGVNIITMLSRNFLTLVAIAALIASPIAWLITHYWLQDFVYRAAIPVWAFLGAALGALGIAFLTILSQTIRAALINPVDALRDE